MNWRSFPVIGFTVMAVACDLPGRNQAADTTATAAPPPAATATPAASDTTLPSDTNPPPAPEPMAPVPVSLADEPWTSTDTGTVAPGMARDQVVALWGQPVAERTAGSWTYLYFRNGCEVSCGTFDVVFLQDGQVVDAIVRAQGHGYAGTSSSPPGRPAAATLPSPPGD
jgi:hypothetical protein